jgi:aconitate hydratase
VRGKVPVRITRADGRVDAFDAVAAVETRLELDLLRVGGVMPCILRNTLANKDER